MGNNKISNIIYPEKFNNGFIFVHYKFEDDLRSLLEETGYVQKFIRKYRKCLKFLGALKTDCIIQNKLFEKLRHNDNLYSIKIYGEKNIRILFIFLGTGKNTIAVLLVPFQEKDSKNNSKTSYNAAIQIAEERINELLDN